jgi:hypothetical protein
MVRKSMGGTFLVLAMLVLPLVMKAQGANATITGFVTDQTKAIIVGAKIEVINADTGVRYFAISNDEGIYTITSLPPGIYKIQAEKQGFKSIVKSDVVLHVQDTAGINFEMALGSASEVVTVESGGVVINTTDASVSTVIDRQFAENLPLSGRSFQSLLYLTPGVTLNAGAGTTSLYAVGQFSVNGQRADSNYWMVDGVSANIGIGTAYIPGNGAAGGLGAFNVLGGTNSLISVDALQEFRIQTSTYAPEYGRTPGGQISIVSRSGSNQLHGSLFDYLRNTIFDATDWFANANSLPKAGEKQNDFGGVLGGPVVKSRTFFFFSYEGLRLRLPQTQLTTVPDLAARQATIPAMQPFLNAYPLPNGPEVPSVPGVAEFNASFSEPASVDAYGLRIDHMLTKRWNIFGRYNYSPSSYVGRGNGSSLNTLEPIKSTTDTGTVGATWTKSLNVVDDIRFNYSSEVVSGSYRMDTFGGGAPAPVDTLFPSPLTSQNALYVPLPLFGTAMFYADGAGGGNSQHQYNLVDTLSMHQGSHDLKIGSDYRRLSPVFGPEAFDEFPYFLSMQAMEAGQTWLVQMTHNVSATFLFHNLGTYAQDTWRISPRLTVTFGLRWDVDFRPSTENGPAITSVTGFSTTDLSNLALAPAGTAIYHTRYGNVAPRVGGAYQVSQSANWGLVLRSGFGVFYDLSSTEVISHGVYYYPFRNTAQIVNATFPILSANATLPPVMPPDASQGTLIGFDPHLNLPYSLQWSAALEQSLGKNQTVTASYVGSSGRRLLLTETINNPNANYLNATLVGNAGSSSYNAFQLQFQRRLAQGLQMLASYSWAHSVDTGSYGAYSDGSFANANANKGDSDFDIRDTFSTALTYSVPVPGRSPLVRAILGEWSTENIVQIHSAPPVSVVDGAFTALSKENSSVLVRPDIVLGQPLYLYGPQYPGGKALNPGAFTDPPTEVINGILTPTRQGSLGRNALRAFGLTQWDFAVHRDFPIREILKLQFRAEMFNVLNHPNFAPYNSSFNTGDPYFGQSTSMLAQGIATVQGPGAGALNGLYQVGGPRSIQLALKLVF